jgi:hypothetical protein
MLGDGVSKNGEAGQVTSTFWVSTYPFFESTLCVVPPVPLQAINDAGFPIDVAIYDPDGAELNSARLVASPIQPTTIDLDQFLGGCKIESGLKHAQVVVTSAAGSLHTCRIHSRESGSFMGPMMWFNNDRAAFLPVTFSVERSYLAAFSNGTTAETAVRCKLICGKRAPETILTLPPRGSRIVSLSSTFPEFASVEGAATTQAYLRLTTRSEGGVGVQLIERTEISGSDGLAYGGLGL